MRTLLGVDIGGTKCAVSLGEEDENGNVIVMDRLVHATTEYPLPGKMLPRLESSILKILKKNDLSKGNISSIGISCGGPLDSKQGLVLSPPNLPGWDEVHIVKFFEEKLGIPGFLQNDANACALAEWLMGAGKGTSNMIFLTFGTGMGAGLILNGQLYTGTNDLGGEVGHISMAKEGPVGFGKAGSFEGFCSGGGIAQLARSVVGKKLKNGDEVGFCTSVENIGDIDAKIVASAAQDGDSTAIEIIRISAEYLGSGLSILIDVLNPECIVIGSIYARNEELFKPFMQEVINKQAISAAVDVCQIKPAALGDSVGDYASLCVAAYGK